MGERFSGLMIDHLSVKPEGVGKSAFSSQSEAQIRVCRKASN